VVPRFCFSFCRHHVLVVVLESGTFGCATDHRRGLHRPASARLRSDQLLREAVLRLNIFTSSTEMGHQSHTSRTVHQRSDSVEAVREGDSAGRIDVSALCRAARPRGHGMVIIRDSTGRRQAESDVHWHAGQACGPRRKTIPQSGSVHITAS